jgi:hypothetical protein
MAPGSGHRFISSTAEYKKFHGMITRFTAAEHRYSELHLTSHKFSRIHEFLEYFLSLDKTVVIYGFLLECCGDMI